MRTLVVTLGLITFASCPEQIGDRCGDALPPCPSGTACVDGLCRPVTGSDGGAAGAGGGGSSGGLSGGGAGGGTSGGLSGGGGEAALDAGEDAGGAFDAGVDAGIDAGGDGGPARDAGRVLTVILRDLYAQTDGGIDEYPRPGAVATALFFLADGGELRIPMTTDGGGEFVAENVPPGPWVVDAPPMSGVPAFFDVGVGDNYDTSFIASWGRPSSGAVTTTTLMSFDLTLQPWDEFDSLQLVSQRAGSLFAVEPPLSPNDVRFVGQSTPRFVQGPAIRADEDVRVSQFKVKSLDSGVELGSIVGTATLSGTPVPGAVIAATLLPPTAVGRVSIRLDAGFVLFALAGEPDNCAVDVTEEIGGTRTSNDPAVMFADMPRVTPFDVDVPYPGRALANGRVICARSYLGSVPLFDGGLERTDGGQLNAVLRRTFSTIDRLRLDGGVITTPAVTAPESILVDGQSSPFVRSQSPTVSWAVPLIGNPNRYTVLVWRFTRSGASIRREQAASLYTTSRQVRIPLGVLTRGERYAIQVFGTQAEVPNPARPFVESVPSSYGSTYSPVFVVN